MKKSILPGVLAAMVNLTKMDENNLKSSKYPNGGGSKIGAEKLSDEKKEKRSKKTRQQKKSRKQNRKK